MYGVKQESDACGGKLFNWILRPGPSSGDRVSCRFLRSSENHLLAAFSDGRVMGWCFRVEDGWNLEFSTLFNTDVDGNIENVAFFSQVLTCNYKF